MGAAAGLERNIAPHLIAGAAAGAAGLLVFLIIHHFWIKPIWFILPPGLVIAALGGLAVGWSYAEIGSALPPRPFTFLVVVALIALSLSPAILLAQTRPALIDIRTGVIPPGDAGRVIAHVVLEMLLPAVILGGMAGWFLGHTPRAALATALAGLVFALGPGHNVPLLGSTSAVTKGLALLLAITLVSAWVMVEASAWLGNR